MNEKMKKREYLPYVIVLLVSILWIFMFPYFRDAFLNELYYMPFLGIIGAILANTTPASAGIVHFPVLTQLHICPAAAVQFSLAIQAYGMGLGTFRWFLVNRQLFITNVIPICLLGGVTGVALGRTVIPVKNQEVLTILFNISAFVCMQTIFFSILFRQKYPNFGIALTRKSTSVLFLVSLLGGLITGWIGFGIDTMLYFLLTVVYKVKPAISIVTSIALMAAVSFAGTMLNMIVGEIPFILWYSAIPGVTLAALFLASYLAVKIGAKNVLLLFTTSLSIDFFITLWTQTLFPMNQTTRTAVTYILVVYLIFIHIKIFKHGYKGVNLCLGEFKRPEKS